MEVKATSGNTAAVVPMAIKDSFGLICYRKSPSRGYEMLMIKKPFTYHYSEFVHGNYKNTDTAYLRQLFSNMTYHEKVDILSMNFDMMWYRIYRQTQSQIHASNKTTRKYMDKKAKFNNSFVFDPHMNLKELLKDTPTVDSIWEFPKGRKDPGESDLDAATREFREETGVDVQRDIRIEYHWKPYTITFTECSVTYRVRYYFAQWIGDETPELTFRDTGRVYEVAGIAWQTIADVQRMQMEDRTRARLITNYKKIKAYIAARAKHAIPITSPVSIAPIQVDHE